MPPSPPPNAPESVEHEIVPKISPEDRPDLADHHTDTDEVLSIPGTTDWLDDNRRHRRRRRTPPTGPVDRWKRKWRRWRRHRRALAAIEPWYRPRNIVLAIAAVVFIALVSVLLSAYIRISDIRRAPLLPVESAPSSIGTNIVLLGSNGPSGALALDPNTMVVQFIHISANWGSGQVIDLPRDLLLGSGSSATTVESLYQSGGVVALISALQKDMGLTVNHVIETSFSGYAEVTDDLGGLSIKTDTGKQQFTGSQAQAYAAEPNPVGGTIETGHRYQHWSKAMLEATLQPGVLLNPFTLWSVFSHTTSNIVVDDTLGNSALMGLVWDASSLSPSDLHFFTAPNGGYGTFQGKHVLLANPPAFSQLSTAIRTDNLATIGLFQ
ncbi:MAG: LCP family protein [Marmoricola sp.]